MKLDTFHAMYHFPFELHAYMELGMFVYQCNCKSRIRGVNPSAIQHYFTLQRAQLLVGAKSRPPVHPIRSFKSWWNDSLYTPGDMHLISAVPLSASTIFHIRCLSRSVS